jgi:menaquinol-cytochrome c reductase iron-sulfur subunit
MLFTAVFISQKPERMLELGKRMNNDENNGKIDRRTFLKYVVLGGAGLVTVAIATPLVGYFLSPGWKQSEQITIPVARLDSIPVGIPTFVRFEQRVSDAWLITTESQGLWILTKNGKDVVVYDPHCTHLRCPYYWDDVQGVFVCPCHGGRFDIDGNVLAGPPPRPLDRLESLVEAGEIEITGKVIRG